MSAKRVIGVDLGGTKILAGLVDGDGNVERRRETMTPLESQEALLAGVDAAVEDLMDERVVGLGFGIPSRIDQATGRAEGAVNIPLHEPHDGHPWSSRILSCASPILPAFT